MTLEEIEASFRFQSRELPLCPHCDCEYDVHEDPVDEYYEEGTTEIMCNCGKEFKVQVNVEFSYTTDQETQGEDE